MPFQALAHLKNYLELGDDAMSNNGSFITYEKMTIDITAIVTFYAPTLRKIDVALFKAAVHVDA